MIRIYHHVGDLPPLDELQSPRIHLNTLDDVMHWAERHSDQDGLTFTFIIDTDRQLWCAPRRTEHVACSRGQPVFAAGEITFDLTDKTPFIIEITNQSTGFCPEIDSWGIVALVLDQIGIEHPGQFTTRYIFRLCTECGQKNVVKEDWYICGVCDAPLSENWNFD